MHSYIMQWFVVLYTNLLVFASFISRFGDWVEFSRCL